MTDCFKNLFAAAFLCLLSFTAIAQTDTTQQVAANRANSRLQQQKPYIILVSADGFRYDYAEKYHTEHLLALANSGVRAASLMPSFPSITFPNHYTLVTGLYPSHHGIISNRFYNAEHQLYYSKNSTNTGVNWYNGTPIWTLAEQQRMLSACFYWVGSEATIKGVQPTYYYHFNKDISIHNRIQDVHNWLMLSPEKRPHLITFYLPEVDQISHKKGPDAPETIKVIKYIDSVVYELTKTVAKTGLDVNFIFLSDHGMVKIPTDNPLPTPAALDTANFIITSGEGLLVNVYAKKGHENAVMQAYQQLLKNAGDNYKVFLKNNVPDSLHYGKKDDRAGHIGDIVLLANYPHIFILNSAYVEPGAHGYEPHDIKDMQATFYAWGPDFKKGVQIPTFNNVDVYAIIAKVLRLKITEKIDGNSTIADKIVIPYQNKF
ncbi:alkaline phosphatase family protein [Mucilaginibacter mali]|uniref:Alkaline phosphatase family protein n=1 Tax=Mucilaginibacter mali TaxID=2740462 RepID=A0A7D4UK33_9SPHI|nr:ectonucleotide pyrophosphatase/phosphodiesterase [Mucilaginibacter mali]QKJ29982.1 alkaline phosphatase family protein [Mucilaginibacter mali]